MKQFFSFSIAIFFILMCRLNAQNIEITNQTTFHKATIGSEFGVLEDFGPPDNGGVIYVFVRNLANAKDSISDFKISQNGAAVPLLGWRAWPYTLEAAGNGNNVSTITAKGLQSPLTENNIVTIEVWTKNGGYSSQIYTCVTPKIRLANVIPSRNKKQLYLYLRNDDNVDYTINEILINEKSYSVGNNMEIVGNSNIIKPGQILIAKMNNPSGYNELDPLAIRVAFTNIFFQEDWVGAGVRVVSSEFYIGTWPVPMNDSNIDERIRNRRYRYTNMHGNADMVENEKVFQQFFMKNIRFLDFGNPVDSLKTVLSKNFIQQHNNVENIRYWTLFDEPELSGGTTVSVQDQLIRNNTIWENDTNTPSFVNLCSQVGFNRYGWMTDVVAMDQYAAPPAPNFIPNTWIPVIGREGVMRQAFEYTEYLKFNTEPRRMQTWSQLQWNLRGITDPRDQPRNYHINYQFWAHIAGGAKAIEFYELQARDETVIPEQYLEGLKLTTQVSSVRNLIMYGEYANNISVNATPANKVISRSITSEDAMLIIALNDNTDFEPSGLYWDSFIDSVNYTLEFDLPSWIEKEEVYQLLPDGFKGYDFTLQDLGNNRYRIVPNNAIYKESHIYVIAKKDTVKPEVSSGLNIPKQDDDFNFVLSWNEPHDNYGTLGYILKYNGATVDTVYWPVYTVENRNDLNCATGVWSVYAFDNSWNIGQPASVTLNAQNPDAGNTVFITTQPETLPVITEGESLFLNVEAVNAIDYEWQYSFENINWQTVTFPEVNVNANNLNISVVSLWFHKLYLRVIAKTYCGTNDTSDLIMLTVLPNAVKEIKDFNFSIVPNPSNNVFTIYLEVQQPLLQVKIFNTAGQIVSEKDFQHEQTITIDASDFSEGIYFVEFNNGRQLARRRILKY